MKLRAFLSVTAMCTALIASSARAQDLPRSALLGVSGSTTSTDGAVVERVTPNSTAQALGLLPGDVILTFNGGPVANMSDIVRAMQNVRANDTIRLQIKRGAQALALLGRAYPRPTETYAGASVRYGAVAHNGGLLRDILVMPEGKPDAPVVYLIQGYTCYSIEVGTPGGNFYKELIPGLIERGIGFYRVEKAGMGDSRGGTSCAEGGFDAELAGFKAAYAHLRTSLNIPANRIFLLGHSMGGTQAPMVAAASGEDHPRGVAVYGTALRNWHDYTLQVIGIQSFYANGSDPAGLEDLLEVGRPILKAIYQDGKSPAEVAASSPQAKEFLEEMLQWDGKETLLYRTATYWRELTAKRTTAAWRDTKAQVLAMYGESDFAAIDATDHIRIADIANHYRPGSGQYVFVPKTGHTMQMDGTMAEARAATQAGSPPTNKPYNRDITKILADWVMASMGKPAL
jgi:pimeloyl-ACP methyl ester carboxylesterase